MRARAKRASRVDWGSEVMGVDSFVGVSRVGGRWGGIEGGVGEGGLGGEFDACADVGVGEEVCGGVEGDDFGVIHDSDAVAEDFGFRPV